MFIYMAAVHTNRYKHDTRWKHLNDRERHAVMEVPHLLESYHYVHKQKFVDGMREMGDKVFIDSGAFSAYTLGVDLDLVEYCNYIKRNDDIIRYDDGVMMASVLDGIGDPQLTYENQLAMEREGVRPLPCFHAGEDERYLEYYVANYEYITLGGMVGTSNKQLMIWLDRMFDKYLTDGSGNPKIKVHGFGITAIPVMERYPWWSCDSSSWIQSAAFGGVVTPDHGNMSVSDKSPSLHVAGQHVETLTDIENEAVIQMFIDQGFTYERLSQVYESRAAYNLWAFGQINKTMNKMNPNNFKSFTQELF